MDKEKESIPATKPDAEKDEKGLSAEIKSVPEDINKKTVEEDPVAANIPPEVEKIISTLPEKEQKSIKSLIQMQMSSISGYRPMANPLVEKMDASHISTVLKNTYWNSIISKIFMLIYFLLGASLFIFLTIYFGKSNTSLYTKIITIVLSFLAGSAAGFGIGKTKR